MTSTSQEEDSRIALLRDRYEQSLGKVSALFGFGRVEGAALDDVGAYTAGSILNPRGAKRRKQGASDDSSKLDHYSLTTREHDRQRSSEQSSQSSKPQSERTQQRDASKGVAAPPVATATTAPRAPAPRKVDDDYDEFDEDEGEEDEGNKDKDQNEQSNAPSDIDRAAPVPSTDSNRTPAINGVTDDNSNLVDSQQPTFQQDSIPPQSPAKPQPSAEDIRKKLEADKKTLEDSVKRSFHTQFFTLENDRDAMLDQQKLEESERQVEAEMSSNSQNAANATVNGVASGLRDKNRVVSNPTTSSFLLSSNQNFAPFGNATFGSSNLPLKHLIERIDMKRSEVAASDAELRSLMNEVRKNRSKWTNEDRVGQEELYENAESVLDLLKGMTEHSTPFLTRVNKRDAPDYYNGELFPSITTCISC